MCRRTYPHSRPSLGVPDHVVSSLSFWADRDWLHLHVLGQPHAKILVPTPAPLVPARMLARITKGRPKADLQLLGGQVLVPVLRAGVEHVKQGFLGEVRHFLLNRLRVPDGIALWKVELWLWWLWWLVAGERESLFGNATVAILLDPEVSQK